jgi:hypothetical protein
MVFTLNELSEDIERKGEDNNRTSEKKGNAYNRAHKRNTTNRKRSNSYSSISTAGEEIVLILISTDEGDSENDAQCLYC